MSNLENIVVIGTSHENLSLLERENFMRTRPKYIIEKLYSEKKQCDYNAFISIDGVNEKGYPNFKPNFQKNKK